MNDEGFRASPYLDTVNVPTIGYGTTRILGKAVSMNDPDISKEDARIFLRAELFQAMMDAQQIIFRFDELNSARQELLSNMAYNLGMTGLSGFKKMIVALTRLDYDIAAEEMLDSKWAKQVGPRATRLADVMRSGQWS